MNYTLQHAATYCNPLFLSHSLQLSLSPSLPHSRSPIQVEYGEDSGLEDLTYTSPHYTLQHAATHCNTLQHTATHCNVLFENSEDSSLGYLTHTSPNYTLQRTATHCNTLQHTAIHCNTLQHTATHCNTPAENGEDSGLEYLTHTSPNYIRQHTATHCNTPVENGEDSGLEYLTHKSSNYMGNYGDSPNSHTNLQQPAMPTQTINITSHHPAVQRRCVAVCCSVLQCVVLCCSVLCCGAVC